MPPFLSGGEMIEYVTFEDITYAELPHKFEAGTVNAGGAVGLAAAIDYIEQIGIEAIEERELELTRMALEGMQATMFTTDFKVVDMLLATQVPGPSQVLLKDDLIERAHKMGENIIKAVQTPVEERGWLGDEDMGWCPNCHSNALVLGEMQWDGLYYPIECQVCGAGGNLEQTADGKWKFVIQKDGLLKDRTTVAGRAKHLEEIAHTQGGFFANPENREIVASKIGRYKNKQFKGI